MQTFQTKICMEAGATPVNTQADRFRQAVQMFAVNINPVYLPQFSERLSGPGWPGTQAIKPLRRSDVVRERKLKWKEENNLERGKKVARQIAWVKEQLPQLLKENPSADQLEMAKLIRDAWNQTAVAKDKWATKTAQRRLARATR